MKRRKILTAFGIHAASNSLIVVAAFMIGGCGFSMGPANPEKVASQYLRERGVRESTISHLLERSSLDDVDLASLSDMANTSVLFLLGNNPSVSNATLRRLIAHSDAFVRAGSARNPNLSAEQQNILAKDESHTVLTHLAYNPQCAKDVLLYLRRTRGLEPIWFSWNPSCPDTIAREILGEGDKQAIERMRSYGLLPDVAGSGIRGK